MDLSRSFPIDSQTSDPDKESFLRVQAFIEGEFKSYHYVEIGSYLGGTLSPHLTNACCKHVFSIDIRVDSMWDERNSYKSYAGVTTDEMIELLSSHHSADELARLETSDADSAVLRSDRFRNHFHLALVDGEHTNPAVFYDFLNLRTAMAEKSIVLFHDSHIVWQGLRNIRSLLDADGAEYAFYFLPDSVGALLLGAWPAPVHAALEAGASDILTYEENAKTFLIRQTIRGNLKLAKRLVARFGEAE